MNRRWKGGTVGVAALLSLIGLVGCGSAETSFDGPTVEATRPSTSSSSTTSTSLTARTNPSRLEDAFVDSVRTDTVTITGTDAEILALGYEQCADLDAAVAAGRTVEEHIRIVALQQFGADEQEAEDIGYVMGLAFTVLCPEYAAEAEQAFIDLSGALGDA